MCQLAISSLDVTPGVDIGIQTGRPLTHAEIQSVYDYEFEAARIGQRLICDLGHQERRFDRDPTRGPDLHLMIREVWCGQNHLITRVYERRQRRGEGMIRAGGNDQILEAAGNPELSQSFGEQRP
jgi:hypothetical protein